MIRLLWRNVVIWSLGYSQTGVFPSYFRNHSGIVIPYLMRHAEWSLVNTGLHAYLLRHASEKTAQPLDALLRRQTRRI